MSYEMSSSENQTKLSQLKNTEENINFCNQKLSQIKQQILKEKTPI